MAIANVDSSEIDSKVGLSDEIITQDMRDAAADAEKQRLASEAAREEAERVEAERVARERGLGATTVQVCTYTSAPLCAVCLFLVLPLCCVFMCIHSLRFLQSINSSTSILECIAHV